MAGATRSEEHPRQYQEDVDLGPDKDSAYVYGPELPNLPRSVYASVKLSF